MKRYQTLLVLLLCTLATISTADETTITLKAGEFALIKDLKPGDALIYKIQINFNNLRDVIVNV
jgi:hypothetical protein